MKRVWAVLAAVLCALGAVSAGSVGSVHAGGATSGEAEITIEAGVAGVARRSSHIVVAVTVDSSKALDGHVELTFGVNRPVHSFPIEIAGGASKRVVAVMQVPYDNGADMRLQARLMEDAEPVATAEAPLGQVAGATLVGVTQGIAEPDKVPARVALPGDRGPALLMAVDRSLLAGAGVGLTMFDALVTVSSDVNALQGAERQALLAWIHGGGRLLVDDDADLSVLPPEWVPEAGRYVFAGGGEVRRTAGQARSGTWTAIIEPARASRFELDDMFGLQDLGESGPSSLAARAGVGLPALTPLLIALGVYALFVGPVIYFVLRRMGRLTFAWVAIPVAALVLSGVVAVIGRNWGSAKVSATNTYVDAFPGGSLRLSQTLVASANGGQETVTLPAGWTALGSERARQFGVSSFDSPQNTVEASENRTDISVALDPGSLTTIDSAGLGAPVPLEVTATVVDHVKRTVSGTIRNTGTEPIEDVAVFVGGASEKIGVLAPGEERTWELQTRARVPRQSGTFRQVWSGGIGFGQDPNAPDAPAPDTSLVSWALLTWERASLSPNGSVRAGGWSRQPADHIERSGERRDRTLLTVTAPLTTAADGLIAAAVRTEPTSIPFGFDGREQASFRMLVPPSVSGVLFVDNDFGFAGVAIEAWDGEDWVELEAEGRTGYLVPEALYSDGSLEIRGTPDMLFSENLPSLRSEQ